MAGRRWVAGEKVGGREKVVAGEEVGGWGSDYGPWIHRQLGMLKSPKPGSSRTRRDGER